MLRPSINIYSDIPHNHRSDHLQQEDSESESRILRTDTVNYRAITLSLSFNSDLWTRD